jgi:aminoglycoside phosphotransferase family enzyme
MISLNDKVSFLSVPESYHERSKSVIVLQTSHAWLFMTERHVFKMKKPFRIGGFDYSTLKSRRVLCCEEYRLNCRLASKTYLGVVPLVINEDGNLALDSAGRPVEWLVKMKRLPESGTLLVLASHGEVVRPDIKFMMKKLLRFYRHAPVYHFDPGRYGMGLRESLSAWRQELLRPQFAVPETLVREVTELQYNYIDSFAQLLEQRQLDDHVREVHGDLRPEHVFFVNKGEPEIIDCLEFDVELRRLDCAKEIAFLGMECRHAGYRSIERECIDYYNSNSDDPGVPAHLWNFYAALGATTRAGLCAWHLRDSHAIGQWTRKAVHYLHDARHYITLAATED